MTGLEAFSNIAGLQSLNRPRDQQVSDDMAPLGSIQLANAHVKGCEWTESHCVRPITALSSVLANTQIHYPPYFYYA